MEALLANLLESKEWRLLADVAYPTRYHETRPLELNRRSSRRNAERRKPEEEIVIEIKSLSEEEQLRRPDSYRRHHS